MSCIITYKGQKYSEEQFKEYFINNKQEFAASIAKNKDVIDSFKRKMEGIDYVFSQSPELETIGNKNQYLQYLSTIFKTSKVKDIAYHNTPNTFEKFDKSFLTSTSIKEKSTISTDSSLGFFFTSLKNAYEGFAIEGNKLSCILNLKNPKIGGVNLNKIALPYKERTREVVEDSYEYFNDVRENLINKGFDGIFYGKSFMDMENGDFTDPVPEYVVFEPEQIHILGSNNDIQGFKEFVSSNVIPEQRVTDEMLNSIESINATENTIRDLAARMADRIGMPVRFESDRTKDYKGKIENNTAVINLAYATLDTPIHEVLGHPIIKAIKYQSIGNKIEEVSKELQEQGYPKYSVTFTDNYDSQSTEFFKSKEEAEFFIKKTNTNLNNLYNNLLKELETGRGKDVLDRIKRDYKYKDSFTEYAVYDFESEREAKKAGASFSTTTDDGESIYIKQDEYSLTEQQEEAIVELLGLYTANRLDSVKDGKLISLLKRLLKEIKSFIRQLLNQKEVEIDKLPDNMTISDLANLLAYSNSKLILPGNEVIYTTPDNEQFKTYAEASNHISELAKNIEEVDLDKNISVDNIDKEIETLQKELDNFKFEIEPFNKFIDIYTNKGRLRQNYWARKKDGTTLWIGNAKETLIEPEYDGFVLDEERFDDKFITKISDKEAEKLYYAEENKFNTISKESREKYSELEIKIHNLENNSLKGFIQRNKEYEQAKKVIEEWKEVNNIQYNPEEVYSRGQEFVSVVGAYSDFDVNLMMQNLLQHIEDNKKAGGEFTISAFTKPIDKIIGHLEGDGGKIKFKIYPKSKDIKWAANTDVYSGSVWDASEKINKDKKSELLGVSYSKYPSIINVNKIQPNLATIIDNRDYHHNELGITLTENNFRLEYDDSVPYSTKKIINSINKILDQKYGKLVKTEIKKQQGKLVTKYIVETIDPVEDIKIKTFENEQDAIAYKYYLDTVYSYSEHTIRIEKLPSGIQPTQTKDTLVESIENIRDKILPTTNESEQDLDTLEVRDYTDSFEVDGKYYNIVYYQIYNYGNSPILNELISKESSFDTEEEAENKIKELIKEAEKIYNERKKNEKEYTNQALINTKIARLKEVAKKYPRSLIRSEVKPISESQVTSLFNESDDLPFQKVPTYNPETKSKTELLDEFNRLIEVSEKMGTKYPDDAINKIKSFLQDLNFNLSTVDEVLAIRGLKDNPKAVIDFAYNLIAFSDKATVEDFAEEIGHLISLHAPQDKNLDRALEAIKDTQIYKDNYLDYVKTYSKPGLALEMTPQRKAALEVLGRFYGKLLTGTLTENDMKISKLSVFKRIMNAFRRMINRTDNFNLRNYLESNRDNFFLEPGKEIKSQEIFYSLEQSENVAYNKMFNAIDNMITSMKSRMAREIKDVSAPLGEYSKRQANLQTQLALLYQMQGNIAYDSAIADFLKSLYVDSANIFKFLEKYFVVKKQTEEITLNDIKFNTEEKIFVGDAIIENNSTTLTFDMFRLGRLKKDADLSTLHYSQLSELREFLMHYNSFIKELGIENLSNDLLNDNQLDDLAELLNYVKTSLSSIEEALKILSSKKMPESIENLIDEAGVDINDIPKDIVDALKDTNIKGDVGMMEYLMGTTRDSSQPILRLFNATVKNIMHIAKRNTLSFAGKFLDKLNHRIGQSMDWAYERYNDKFTGYLLSKHNYGRFKNERDTFFKDINAKYEYPVDFNAKEVMFNRIITRFNNNDKYKEELKALKVKLNKEVDANKRTQYEEQIDTLNTLIDNVELDHRKLKSYQNEINNWFKDNTVELENVEEIIQSVINDPELSSTEKTVWYNNNVTTNEDGDVMGYKNELVRPSDKYLNPDYSKLSSTDLEDLNYIKQTKEELDKFLPTKINRLAPQTYQSAMDTLIKTQLPELVDKLKFLGKDIGTKKEDDEIGELVGDRVNYEDETRIIKYNPTRYTKLLLEPNNISTDLLSSMIGYAKMVSEFKEKAERIEQLEFIAQNIKNGYTVNTDTNMSSPSNTSNLVKQMENYLRVQIMGITYPDVTIPVLNVKPTKLLKNFARFVTLKNLGLNFATQFVDFTTSKIWYHVEKTMGDTVTRKSSALGFAAFKELAQDSIKESSSTIKNNKLSAILRTLGLSDNLHSVFNDLDKNILMRDVTNKVLFAGYRASNFYVSGNAALAGMYNFRLYNGKWYTEREFGKIENPTEQFDSLPSAYDNMRVENGLMSIDGMNTKTLNLFTRRMNNLISKIDGKLSEEDKTYAHSTLIGIVTLIHRDWILDGISRRLKKRGYNFDTNAVDEGYWLTTARFMKDFFANKEKTRNLKFLVDNYNALNDMEKEGVRRTMKELMMVVGSIAVAIIMNLGDDDDDRELDYIRDMAAYLATRSTVEITAFYNPFEYLYAATDVFVIGRDLKRIMTFTEMFDAREIESGKWEGWTRSQKYFLQNIPGVNGALSLANPEASNRFIINNVLGFAGGLENLKYYNVPLVGSIDEVELREIERDKR